MAEDWLDRWEKGRTGWHEVDGNSGLKAHWRASSGSVLVPLCGKTLDLVWLAKRGHDVTLLAASFPGGARREEIDGIHVRRLANRYFYYLSLIHI